MNPFKWLWKKFCNLPMPWYPLFMMLGVIIYVAYTR